MNLSHAIAAFHDWSQPWTFVSHVRSMLDPHSSDASRLDAMLAEASRPEHWRSVELAAGCASAHAATKKKFPEIGDVEVAVIVRAASFEWR
jgi:hypothetical protein